MVWRIAQPLIMEISEAEVSCYLDIKATVYTSTGSDLFVVAEKIKSLSLIMIYPVVLTQEKGYNFFDA